MMRAICLLSLAALGACSSGDSDPIVGAAIAELRGVLPGGAARRAEAAGPPPRAVTRADIEAANVAAIRARLESDPQPTLMLAASANGGYVTYASPLRQEITLRGSQIAATRGLGADLLSASSGPVDPLVRAIPPARWPARVERSYEFPADGPRGRIETYTCTFEPGEPSEAVILERRYAGFEIAEICQGEAGSFENLHFADAASGFVWRSLQWVGPEMELVDLQVLEPYTGN